MNGFCSNSFKGELLDTNSEFSFVLFLDVQKFRFCFVYNFWEPQVLIGYYDIYVYSRFFRNDILESLFHTE